MKVKKFVACRRGTVWALGVAIQTVERVSRTETVSSGWSVKRCVEAEVAR